MIVGQMRRLIKPIPLPYKTGTSSQAPPMIPAVQMGLAPDIIERVENLISACARQFERNRSIAITHAEEALVAWNSLGAS
jgi:hypothetical protein